MDPLVESWLKALLRTTERYYYIAGSAFLLFYVLFKKPMLIRRIQQRFPKARSYLHDVLYSTLTMFIFATVAVLVLTVWFPYTNLYNDIAERSTVYYALSWVWMILLHDAYFYWIHRLMHLPRLYRTVHRVHHKSTNPSPWTAYSFHPLEAVLEAGILPLIAFTLPVHKAAMILFFLFQLVYNVYGHLGFELYPKGFHKTWIGRWVNTSVCHNQHHRFFNGNYGLYTLIWDRVFGTLRSDYDRAFEEVTGPATSESQTSIKAGEAETVG